MRPVSKTFRGTVDSRYFIPVDIQHSITGRRLHPNHIGCSNSCGIVVPPMVFHKAKVENMAMEYVLVALILIKSLFQGYNTCIRVT